MFGKRLKLKKVGKYPAPKYPVMEMGEVLSVPKELRLGDMALGLAKPLAPVLLSAGLTALSARPAQAVSLPPAAVVSPLVAPGVVPLVLQDKEIPTYPVRKLNATEIAGLIKELNLEGSVPENVRGIRAVRHAVLTEAQGRQILDRFFAKNALRFQKDVPLEKNGADFAADGYDAKRRIGYEFIPAAGEQDLTPDEIARIEKGLDGERILLIRPDPGRLRSAQEIIQQMQEAASAFLQHVYRDGVLGQIREIETLIAGLLSDDPKAGAALTKIGPPALWQLQRRPADDRIKTVIGAIRDGHVQPLLESLDSDDVDVRDAATWKLIDFGPAIAPWVEEHRGRSEGKPGVQSCCAEILKAIRE